MNKKLMKNIQPTFFLHFAFAFAAKANKDHKSVPHWYATAAVTS